MRCSTPELLRLPVACMSTRVTPLKQPLTPTAKSSHAEGHTAIGEACRNGKSERKMARNELSIEQARKLIEMWQGRYEDYEYSQRLASRFQVAGQAAVM